MSLVMIEDLVKPLTNFKERTYLLLSKGNNKQNYFD